uniref:DOMON domain-containing protein n=1 Tax=Pseudo-nitzschia australis TaxID=44445 RepID=A0A6U9ZKQ1_9STRA|mmetsp:Transcript_24735/g.54281  ORF Transcript_24735/g.54281 Transcript_24735/m.54281 type:complete len:531 (-) Transcript_24735:589-2181(-)
MWLRLLVVASFLISVAESQYNCRYSEEIPIHKDGTSFMQHYVNDDEGTFTMRIRYTDGQSWIGIGINMQGKGKMAPAEAVIGDINRGVKRYSMESDDKTGSGVIPLQDINGHLKSSSFVQTEGGESILEFTHDLVIRNPGDDSIVHEISESSVWIWAIGLPNNAWEGKHKLHGAFEGFELYSSCVQATNEPTQNPTVPLTAAPTKNPTVPLTTEATKNPTVPPVPASTSDPIGSEYPIDPEYNIKNETELWNQFDNKTLVGQEDTSSEIDLGNEDDKEGLMSDETSDEPPHNIPIISFIESSTSEVTRDLWVVHGILMGVAWGILAPLAIGAAYLRNSLTILKENALWLRIHFHLCFHVALFTFVGFVLAVVATKQDDDLPHFKEDIHHQAGLAIFILVIVQAVAGIFRPSPVSSTNTERNVKSGNDESEETPIDAANLNSSSGDKIKTNTTTSSSGRALYARKYWEYTHRLLGMILLGLAWYNCHSGIVLQAENYDQDDEESLLRIFWGITGGIAGSIFFVGYVLRVSA